MELKIDKKQIDKAVQKAVEELKQNNIWIPEGMTNGEVLQALFPNMKTEDTPFRPLIGTDIDRGYIDNVFDAIREFERQVIEDREKALAEIIQKYDFVVGSKENYEKLREILPEDANIIFSQYIENPTTIFAVKKFDIMDYFDMRGKADE